MYQYKFEVTRVVDGDTVDGNVDLGFGIKMFKRIRLYGIDAPESRTRDLVEKAKGIAATQWLINNLETFSNNGFTIMVQTENDSTGKYGRLLGTLYAIGDQNPININQAMITEGHAVVYE